MYFFHKFILDDVSMSTPLQVLIPFAVFFLLSLFLVYLAKPVIKKVSRAEMEKKKRGRGNFEDRRMPAAGAAGQTGQVFYDSEDYLPQPDYRTGPMPLAAGDEDIKIHAPAPRRDVYQEEIQQTSVIDGVPGVSDTARVSRPPQEAYGEPMPRQTQPPAPRRPVRQPAQSPEAAPQARRDVQPDHPARVRQEPPVKRQPTARRSPEVGYRQEPELRQSVPQSSRVVSSVEIPAVNDDFFAKYDDPEYIERRLQELKGGRSGDV